MKHSIKSCVLFLAASVIINPFAGIAISLIYYFTSGRSSKCSDDE